MLSIAHSTQQQIEGFNYRLKLFNKRWLKTAEDEAHASYTRLPPGHYQFEVKAIAPIDLPAVTFELHILPPWYLTWWAKSLAILIIIATVLAVIANRTRRLKESNLWLQKSVEAQTAELKQANDKLQQVANYDALTELLNRRGFLNLCEPH
ncbi:MAG: triple tyrosine motif-containing protein [Marinicellaceae bacterium]